MAEVTRILAAVAGGDGSAADRLLSVVYDDLHRMASAQMRRERAGQTLQATALVHEAYLRLFGTGDGGGFQNRSHFFAAAGEAMRRILVEQARRRRQAKRGGGRQRVDLDAAIDAQRQPSTATTEADPADVLAVHEAVAKLERFDPRMARVVKLRYFVGMTIAEAAEAMGLTSRTVNRDWLVAKAWLRKELAGAAAAETAAGDGRADTEG
jgi:RNA polymerase sigma factor (TIGR02999 family)